MYEPEPELRRSSAQSGTAAVGAAPLGKKQPWGCCSSFVICCVLLFAGVPRLRFLLFLLLLPLSLLLAASAGMTERPPFCAVLGHHPPWPVTACFRHRSLEAIAPPSAWTSSSSPACWQRPHEQLCGPTPVLPPGDVAHPPPFPVRRLLAPCSHASLLSVALGCFCGSLDPILSWF